MVKLWDGTIQSNRLPEPEFSKRNVMFANAKAGDWLRVFEILKSDHNLINVVQPEDTSLNTLVHYAAQTAGNEEVIQLLLNLAAFRNVKNASGFTPYDYGQEHSYTQLEPLNLIGVSKEFLSQVEDEFFRLFFEGLMLSNQAQIRLPQLDVLLELSSPKLRFSIVGYSYEAKYWLRKQSDLDIKLFLQTGSSFVTGSEQTHEITPEGSKLVAKEK